MLRTIALFAGLLACCARGSIQISWISGLEDAYRNNAATTPVPSTWLAQLIYTPDAVASPIDPDHPLIPTGGEVVLHAQPVNRIALDGVVVGDSAATASLPDIYVNGFVYTRIFNVDATSSEVPTLYGESTVTGNPSNAVNGGLRIQSGLDFDTINQHDAQGIRVTRLVRDPGPLALQPAQLGGGTLRLSFFGKPGRFYRLLQRDDLLSGGWTPAGPTGSGSNLDMHFDVGAPSVTRRYFRIEETIP